MEKMFLDMIMFIKIQIFNINGKSQTNRDHKSNLLFLQRHDQSQRFRTKLIKNRQKNITKVLIFTSQLKKMMTENIYSVNPLYLLVNHASGYL